jgi:hypothetical protein
MAKEGRKRKMTRGLDKSVLFLRTKTSGEARNTCHEEGILIPTRKHDCDWIAIAEGTEKSDEIEGGTMKSRKKKIKKKKKG